MKLTFVFLAGVLLATPLVAQTSKPAPRKPAKITMAQAKEKALAKQPGVIKSQELEKEHGKLIYSFDIQTAAAIHEVNIDAYTGAVIEDSIESPAAEAREAAADKTKAASQTKKKPQ